MDEDYFNDRVNDPDPSKRWYPLPKYVNVTDERADSIMEEFDDQSSIRIQSGPRSISALIIKTSNAFLGKLKGWGCKEFGTFKVDKTGGITGEKEGNKLYPITVDDQSWDPKLVPATDKTVQKVMVKYKLDIDVADEDLEMITAGSIVGFNMLRIEGLLDLDAEFSDTTTTGTHVKITTDYGDAINKEKVPGLLAADMKLYNIHDDPTKATPITFTITEDANEEYDLVWAAQGAGEDMELVITKDGYDGSGVTATPFS